MADSPFPRSHHCLHFVLSRVRRQEKVSQPRPVVRARAGVWGRRPDSPRMRGRCSPALSHSSRPWSQQRSEWHGGALGSNHSYREDLEGGSPWLLSQHSKERTVSAWLRLEFQDSESSFSSCISGSAWSSGTNPRARKIIFFHVIPFFKVISVWS